MFATKVTNRKLNFGLHVLLSCSPPVKVKLIKLACVKMWWPLSRAVAIENCFLWFRSHLHQASHVI
eukprot:1920462-Prorocentrum_lima.AAC.1